MSDHTIVVIWVMKIFFCVVLLWDDREWDGWVSSLTQWRWVWVNSGSWWWTGKPGMLQSMGSHRVGHDWVNELKYLSKYLTLSTSHSSQFWAHQLWQSSILPKYLLIFHAVSPLTLVLGELSNCQRASVNYKGRPELQNEEVKWDPHVLFKQLI